LKPEGWGPWNVRAANALVHLPTGLELRLGIRTPDGVEHWELRWRQVERLGSYSEALDTDEWGGRSGEVLFRVGGCRFAMAFTTHTHRMASCRVAPADNGCTGNSLLVRLSLPWGNPPDAPDDFAPACWVAAGANGSGSPLRVRLGEGPLVIPLDSAVQIHASSAGFTAPPKLISTNHLAPFETNRLSQPDELDEALWRGVAWNTIYHPRLKRLMTPVSRDWCVDDNNFGDYVLFPWDTFFCSLLAARRDKDLAYANVRAALAEMTDRGMLPNVSGGAGQTLDRSQPPVGAYCVWKLYQRFGEADFLAEVYPALMRWHAFWMKYRDGNGDGLLEWGSDPIPAPVDWWKPHTQQAAKWESGLDNSPMYENIPFNEAANTLELADIGLTCLYAADAEALANMADVLNKPEDAAALRAEHAALTERINALMWDEERGLYVNRHWDGRLAERYSPTSFYPLLAGVATPERAERCVRQHLMNPDEFWGEWVIPSISRRDPNFPVQKYWQGRIWPPLNFLAYEGLRRYGFHAEADALAEKSAALFLKEWREEGHIHENYNALTADGDDVDPADPEGSSDPIYTWGGLLAYIALDAHERRG
jgi:hypothetical protein